MVRIISGGIKVKMKFFIQFPEKVRRRGPIIRFTGKHYISIQIDHILSLSAFGIVILETLYCFKNFSVIYPSLQITNWIA